MVTYVCRRNQFTFISVNDLPQALIKLTLVLFVAQEIESLVGLDAFDVFLGKIFKLVGEVQFEISKSLELYVSEANLYHVLIPSAAC